MARARQITLKELHTLMLTRPLFTALELAGILKVSRPTIARLLAESGMVVKIGAARTTRYALRRSVRSHGHTFPLYAVDSNGVLHAMGQLVALHSGFLMTEVPPILKADYAEGYFDGLPFFMDDSRPQGFLGRALAHKLSEPLAVPIDPQYWSSDDLISYLVTRGDDLPGNLVVGKAMMEQVQSVQRGFCDAIPATQRMQDYPELAKCALQEEIVGSSAGGEQPKFTAWVMDETSRAVIVKFSPKMDTPAGLRWADLLLAEYHAHKVLSAVGIATPAVEIIDAGERRFLEVTRFDRVGTQGRRGVLSLTTVEAGLIDEVTKRDWPSAANALLRKGFLSAEDARTIRRLWCFGAMIGNTDMHFGNLSFWWDSEERLALAPVYDMLPMMFAPNKQGEVVVRSHTFSKQPPEMGEDWEVASQWALCFWEAVRADHRISPAFMTEAKGYGNSVLGIR